MSNVRVKLEFAAAAFCLCLLSRTALPQGIDLGDITGGGDGTGNKPAENVGIDPRNGAFATTLLAGTIQEIDAEGDGLNPSPTGSAFIDSVFFIGPASVDPPAPDPFPQAITQSGIEYEFPLADGIGTGYNFILSHRNGGGEAAVIVVGGVDTFTTAVGIHASMGITFDLAQIRATHGAGNVGCFSTVWGTDNCALADLNLFVIFSNDASGVVGETTFTSAKVGAGELLRVNIPANADYLTLACGSNGVDWCDHGTFARPLITAGLCPTTFNIQRVEVTPPTASLGIGGSVQLAVRGFDDEGSPRTITSAASGTTYSATPGGIVTVSANGLVTAVGVGLATVTATNSGLSDTTTVDVQNKVILSDIVAGGNGSGTAPAENIGIDPRNGQFVTVQNNGTITDNDGVNPSPGASEFIDSVFFIDNAGSSITQSGVEFPFPSADRIGTGWNFIFKDRDAGDGATPMMVGGVQTWLSGIGIHASTGITFDLGALRAQFGAASVGCFSTTFGMDDCGGDVNLYAILSSDGDGIIDRRTFRATQNSASYGVMTIPEEADYLTLATGSNGADGCDHGNFAEPVIISGACQLPPLSSFVVAPKSSVLAPGLTVQLKVTGTLESGSAIDLTPGSTGTAYSAAPAGLVTISENGLVTAVANGRATVTATNGAFSDTATVIVQDYIDLGNIVAGGNGKLPPPEGNIGLNADTGIFVQARSNADVPEANGTNPQPLDGSNGSSTSTLIDSVFIMNVGVGQVITSDGVVFDFPAGDAAGGWEAILNGREPGGPDDLSFGTFGPITSGIGCHAAQGITFKLDGFGAIRAVHGDANVKYVSAIAGEASGQAGGSVNSYVILSDGVDILATAQVLNAADSGEFVQLEIPAEAVYITFAVGAAGNGIGADHGAFGLAAITKNPVDVTNISKLDVYPPLAKLDTGAQVQLVLKGTMAAEGYVGVRTTIPANLATYSSGNSSVASVDASGVITAGAAGATEITATVGALSAKVTIIVGEALSLSDVTRGGDGSGNAPVENFGIDPRNGAFVQVAAAGAPGPISDADVEGDGLNPSPGGSAFIDSVFFIGPNEEPAVDPFPQDITQDGVKFDFPAVDVSGTGYNYTFGDLGADATQLYVGGYGPWATGIGMHSSTGITYDLAQLRSTHGSQAVGKLVAFWGTDGCGTADVNLYAILASASGIVGQATFPGALANSGQLLELEIPATANYLTLAVGSNGVDACDHGHFAEAWILPGGGIPPKVFYRADPNNDGAANITDGIYVLNYLFLGGPKPTCLESADPNDDGSINITDGIYILNYLFLGGPQPVDPGPPGKGTPCGPDRADSSKDLGCERYSKC